MRLHYHDLVGMRVVDCEGHPAGRVADLAAERRGEDLCVTALLVGPRAFLRRIAFRRASILEQLPVHEIPWELVAGIDERIHLSITSAELRDLAPHAVDPSAALPPERP